LNLVERNLDHQLWPNGNSPAISAGFEGKQLFGLPAKHLIGESLECLAQHHELPALRIPRPQVKIGQPAGAAAVSPLRSQYDQVERISCFQLEPVISALPCHVASRERFGHGAFVARVQRSLQESLRFFFPQVMGDPQKDSDLLVAHSPLKRVAEIKVPVLLAHGGVDKRVPIVHAREFASAAQKAGVKLERIDYLDEGHGFFLLSNRTDYYKRLADFLGASLSPTGTEQQAANPR